MIEFLIFCVFYIADNILEPTLQIKSGAGKIIYKIIIIIIIVINYNDNNKKKNYVADPLTSFSNRQ
jgi:hypothetical protein